MPRLTTFDGMFPKRDLQDLPPNAAELAEDCDLYAGRVDPIQAFGHAAAVLDVFGQPLTVAPKTIHKAGPVWVGFPEETVVAPDPSERAGEDSFLFVDQGRLMRSSSTWILDGDGPVPVGITPPCVSPLALTMVGGGTALEFPALLCEGAPDPNDLTCAPDADAPEARSYVFTYVTACHEESAPSLGSGLVDVRNGDAVALVDPTTAAEIPANAVARRWYRSVATSDGLAMWHFVGETDIAAPGFVDDVSPLALGEVLLTEDHMPPPDCLEGVAVLGDAITVVWQGSRFWMSEPRLPHAFPPVWRKQVEYPILAILGATAAIEGAETFLGYVITTGTPYFLSGVRPEEVVPREYEVWEPGASRHCAARVDGGVVYASTQALIMLSGPAATSLLDPENTDIQWQEFDPAGLRLAFWNAQLWGVSSRAGFRLPLSRYRQDRGRYLSLWSERAEAIYSSPDTPVALGKVSAGRAFIAQSGAGEQWMPYRWRSRVFTMPGLWWPAAAKVVAAWPRERTELLRARQQWANWQARFGDQWEGFFGQYPYLRVFEPELRSIRPAVQVVLLAGGQEVYSRPVQSSAPFRLPKRRGIDWQFELRGTIPVEEFHFETSIQDLVQLGLGVGNSV